MDGQYIISIFQQLHDEYLDFDIDTSNTIFIATANDISKIPDYVQNRFNWIISIPKYSNDERKEISKKYLINSLLSKYNLSSKDINFTDEAIKYIVEDLTTDFGCGFSVIRNPVNGNIFLFDIFGRPIHMANAMDVQKGVIYFDVPKEGRQTFYEMTGNWFPWACAIYSIFAIFSGFI